MNHEQITPNKKRMLKATRIEVYASLAEKFGSNFKAPVNDMDEDHKVNFQLDRLFTVFHNN